MNSRGSSINKPGRIEICVVVLGLFAAAAGFRLYSENLNRKKTPAPSAESISDSSDYSLKSVTAAGDEEIQKIADKMSPYQLAGQVMMIGYMGETPPPEIISWIRDKSIGGIKIFGWNTENLQVLRRSINEMQSAAAMTEFAIPLFIATDQEGGWVRHIKGNSSITPGNMALGASEITNDAYMTGKYIAEELKLIGINMNFAPTVDVLVNHEAHVIGPRAFSDDPLQTAVLATSYLNGMKKSGIICTAKHFPGHGRTADDSHGKLPVIMTDLEELSECDLLPYDFLIREGLPAVMSGHLAFPEITGNNLPASLSPFFLKEVLREKMDFRGIIITDDMQMNGAISGSSVTESCLSALRAGNDMIMVSHNLEDYEKTREIIIREIRRDPSFEKQIRESVKRILRTKYEYIGKNAGQLKGKSAGGSMLPIPRREASAFFSQQAFRSASLLFRERQIRVPLENEKILLAGQHKAFFDEGLKRFPKARTYYFPYTPFYTAQESELESFPAATEGFDVIIFCASNPASMQMLKTIETGKHRVIILSVLSPAYFNDIKWPESGVAVYGTGKESFAAGFAAIAGDFVPEGTVPLALKEKE